MSNETVLTDEDIECVRRTMQPWQRTSEYARAIEQAVLRSPEVQALRKDAERLDWLDATNAPFKMGWRFGIAPAGNVHPYTVAQLYGALTTVREGIDAAMEKQP